MDNSGWEVYVCYRSLREMSGEKYKSVSPKIKNGLRDLGLCHYMTVFKSPHGDLLQFDFGPLGGDVAISLPGGSSLMHTNFASMSRHSARGPKAAMGEIREETLSHLPPTSVYLGRSKLDLGDIRRFNAVQNTRYQLNRNDCRHYADTLVQQATGLERATAHLMRTSLRKRHEQGPHRLAYKVEKLAQRALEKDITSLLSNSTLGFSALTAAHRGVRFLLPFLIHRGRAALAAASGNRMALSMVRGSRMSTAPGHTLRGRMGQEGRGVGGTGEHNRCWLPRAAMSSRLCSVPGLAAGGSRQEHRCFNFVTTIIEKAGRSLCGVPDEDSIASLAVLNQFEL